MTSQQKLEKHVIDLSLQVDGTLCAFAIATVSLEALSEYVAWANIMLNHADQMRDVAELTYLAGMHGNLNLLEIRESTMRIMKSMRLTPPIGTAAVELFSLGLIRAVANKGRMAKECLARLSDLADEYPEALALRWFYSLERWMRWMDAKVSNPCGFPQAYGECIDLFEKRCLALAASSSVDVVENDGGFGLRVIWSDLAKQKADDHSDQSK